MGGAKLYDSKTALTATELLNERVIPFFNGHSPRTNRVLPDRRARYCDAHDRHEYEIYLAVEDTRLAKSMTVRSSADRYTGRSAAPPNTIAGCSSPPSPTLHLYAAGLKVFVAAPELTGHGLQLP